jgi:uncharacterized protein YjbI with pentapeptide repeats
VLWFRGFLEKNKVMTETLPELLCSDAWWQRVGPALSADGRALVKETLTQAAAKLDDKEKEKFTEALTALRAPSEEQLAWLRDVAAVPNLEDLSNILICHPDTGAPINLENHQLPAVTFKGAVFAGKADFGRATFMGEANFMEAMFTGEANFWGAKFAGKANFWKATFAGKARFTEATFTGEAQFLQATFMSEADFQHAEFLGITIFREAHFKQVASFHAARFSKTVSFRGSDWGAVPDFIGTAWKDGVAIADFVQLQTQLNKGELDWRNPSTSDPAPITDRLQALRKMARDADDRPRELDYFALELQARYQGKGAWAKRFLVNLYGWFSDYGRGILLPFLWLLVLWLLFALGYLCLAVGGCALLTVPVALKEPLLLSLVNILPTLGAGSMARESSLKALYGCDVPTSVHLIAVVEGVIGLILLFLIALGLRNRFRL